MATVASPAIQANDGANKRLIGTSRIKHDAKKPGLGWLRSLPAFRSF